jgi:hypothetical protein
LKPLNPLPRGPKPMILKDYLEFLGKFESIFETALAHESGSKGGYILMKKRG